MRRLLKWTGIVLGSLVLLVILAAAGIYLVSNARLNTTYTFMPTAVEIPGDSASIARGAHLATIRGCVECHGEQLQGRLFLDEPAIGKVYTSNLTAGRGGIGGSYTDEQWVRAIRHGIGADDRPLLIMPSEEFYHLSDGDLSALLAYIKSRPPVDNEVPEKTLGPVARVLTALGELKLAAAVIDHDAPRPTEAPVPGPTAEYGHYLALTTCTGCHGEGFSGGPIPGVPPHWPASANITPDTETGIGNWTEEDFFRALREGIRPDGRQMESEFMPWKMLGKMTDDEIRAVWLYLQTLPPAAEGNR